MEPSHWQDKAMNSTHVENGTIREERLPLEDETGFSEMSVHTVSLKDKGQP